MVFADGFIGQVNPDTFPDLYSMLDLTLEALHFLAKGIKITAQFTVSGVIMGQGLALLTYMVSPCLQRRPKRDTRHPQFDNSYKQAIGDHTGR